MSDLSHLTNFIPIDDHLGTVGQPTADQIADIVVCGWYSIVGAALRYGVGQARI